MRRVDVAADDDPLAVRAQRLDAVEEGVVEAHLEVEPLGGHLTVGEVHAEQRERAVVRLHDAPLRVELRDAEAVGHVERLLAGVEGDAGVPLALGGVEVGAVPLHREELGVELLGQGLGLLEAEGVGLLLQQPLDEHAALVQRPQPVHVPGEQRARHAPALPCAATAATASAIASWSPR